MPKSSRAGARALALVTLLAGALTSSAAAADPLPQAKPEAPVKTSLYRQDGLLGPVRVGPTFGLGAPDGLRFGVFAKWRGLLAAGGAFSYLPDTPVPGIEASVRRVSGEAFARVHPFHGAFFLGLAGGYAQTKGTMSEERMAFRQVQRVDAHAYASTVYLAPHLGFQWMLPMKLTVGFDVGVEIPIVSDAPAFDAAKYGLVLPIEGKGSVADATRYVAQSPIPVIHFLEIGYAL
jgi:hypothetical protein